MLKIIAHYSQFQTSIVNDGHLFVRVDNLQVAVFSKGEFYRTIWLGIWYGTEFGSEKNNVLGEQV